ncbi:MAG: preprotein translocase subunit SecG [bacterium]|nr:preprotein translocase subunit SecG [bacterium]
MNYSLIINIAQIVIAFLLMGSILLQQRGSGLSAAFGGDSNVYRTKRGIEKGLLWATVVLAALFMGLGLFNTFVR